MTRKHLYILILLIPVFCRCSEKELLLKESALLESGKSSTRMSGNDLLIRFGRYCIRHPSDLQTQAAYTRLLSKAGYHATVLKNAERLLSKQPGSREYEDLYLAECMSAYQRPFPRKEEQSIFYQNESAEISRLIRIMDTIDFLDLKIRQEPASSELYGQRGQQFFTINEVAAANWDFDKAIHLDPCNTGSLYGKSFALFKNRKDDQALEYLLRYEHCLPGRRLQPYPNAASFKTLLRQLLNLDSLVKMSDHPAPYLFKRANLYIRAAEFELAVDDIDVALNHDKENSDLYALRAYVNYSMGRQNQALTDIKRAEELGGKKNSPLSKMIREGKSRKP